MSEGLDERLARLEREREEADRRYNDALTALDRALPPRQQAPPPPRPYDTTKLPDVNEAWNIVPNGAPAADGSLKGRLGGFIWRLVGPPLEAQRHFNATLVDHLNRNVGAHEDAQHTLDRLVGLVSEQIDRQAVFQSHLLHLLQTITLYVDTKGRSTAGGQEVLNAGLSAVTDTWLKRWETLTVREDRFVKRLASTLASIEDVRATATLAQQTALSLKREVERLLAGTTGATGPRNELTHASFNQEQSGAAGPEPDLNAFKYLGFEDQFRGSPEDISRRLAEYVARFEGLSDILDIGCGRGEFLELLREKGLSASGVDTNQAMVEASRQRGLAVVTADALSYLQQLPDASLGGIFGAQVAEHLAPDYLMNLLETAAHKVRPGGLLILETINPACWLAFFESYIRDLTHVRPLHPETLQYLVRVSGFHDVSVEFKSPVPEAARLRTLRAPSDDAPVLSDIVDTFNENVAKLNARLFTFQDYAVIGRR